MLSHLIKAITTVHLALAARALRFASKVITEIGYQLWRGAGETKKFSGAVTRCATRLRIRAYELERRIG